MDISRRGFISTISGAAALSVIGLDRRALADTVPGGNMITDFVGRLCYNENPLGPAPAAIQAIQDEAEMAHRYPDWYAESLSNAISSKFDISTAHIMTGIGATEIIRLCATALCSSGKNVIVPYPSYGQFDTEAQHRGSTVRHVNLDGNYDTDLEGILNRIDSNTAAVCLTNPNNPTGRAIGSDALYDFVQELPSHVVLVVDEAYSDYMSGYNSAVNLVRAGNDVVVIKTFSKVYGLAGARIGFAIGPTDIISQMNTNRLFAMISRPSLEAAKSALNAQEHIDNTVELANQTKDYCFGEFDRMGLPYIPSESSFFMVEVGNADYVRSALAGYGLYVRTGWGMSEHLRVSTGTMDEMVSFIEALDEIMSPLKAGGDLPRPGRLELFGNYPNPFNSHTKIKVYMPNIGTARLDVFDINGRLVKTLKDGILDSGEHSFVWNGTNSAGHSVATGSYFYRLVSGGETMTRRMIYLK